MHIHDVLYTDKYCQCFEHNTTSEEKIKVFNQTQQPQDIILKSATMNENENNNNKENNTENPTESESIVPPPPLIHSHEHRFKQHASNYLNRNSTSFYTSVSTVNNNLEKETPKKQKCGQCSSNCLCINCFDIDIFLNTILNIKISQKFEELLNE